MPIKQKIYNQKAETVGEIDLAEKVFGLKLNPALIHQVAVAQSANERQVLAHTKDRSEVRGGGRKPWRQKGTGRARAGSSRSPIWIGGGVVFGPTKDRNFSKKINKKMRQNALLMVLSDKVKNLQFAVLEKLTAGEYKTKPMNEMITTVEKTVFGKTTGKLSAKKDKAQAPSPAKPEPSVKVKRSVLILSDAKDEKIKYSLRNLTGVKILNLENINLLDLLKYQGLIITAEGVKILEKQYVK